MFELIEEHTYTHMEEVPPLIKLLWSRYLKDQFDVAYDDFFGEDDYCNDELTYHLWKWTHDGVSHYLYDINNWPGDNEDGAVFIDIDQHYYHIFNNSDTMISVYDSAPNVNLTNVTNVTNVTTVMKEFEEQRSDTLYNSN